MSEVTRNCYKSYKNLLNTGFDHQKVMNENKISQNEVDELRVSCGTSKYIPKATPDMFYVLCLVACQKDLNKSAHMLETFCKIFRETPEWFCNRNMNVKEVKQTFDNFYYFTLPPIPGKNYNVTFHALKSYDTKHFNFDESERALLMSVSANLFKNGPRNGYIFVYDMKGSKVGHAMKPKLKSLTKMMKYVTEGSLVDVREVHVLNTTSFVTILISILKPMMSEQFFKKIHFHNDNIDFEKFYSDHVPKSCLPSEYGGDLECIEVLHNKHRKVLEQMQETFKAEEMMFNYQFDKFVDDDSDDDNSNERLQ